MNLTTFRELVMNMSFEERTVNIKEEAVYRVKDGELKKITTPKSGYGRQVIVWQDGKITHCEVSFTEK